MRQFDSREFLRTKKTQLTLALLVATGLAAAPFAAEAKSHEKHHSSMSSASQTTTGANMKSSGGNNPSSQGNVGPGTNQAGSMPSTSGTNSK